jgi:hypothetical protein
MDNKQPVPPIEYWVKSCYIPTHTEVWVSYNADDLFYTENHKEETK